ncbi:MAG: O-antigen ligase family protein [Alphaproteobacteria bacterium]|nr:O-antigen ligase family protein [Alphaproteobacteria bacterium]
MIAIKRETLFIKVTQFLLFWNTFVVETTLRTREFSNKSIDWQVMVKMGTWGLTFLLCLFFYKLWLRKMLRLDKFVEILLLTVIVISCFHAPNIAYSLASAFSLIAIFCMLFLASFTLTNKQILWPIILGCTAVTFISLITYFAMPDFARMKEWIGGVHVPGKRLSGIAGSANTVGYISAFCLLALYYYRGYFVGKIPLWFWGFVAVNGAALLMSNSRTSLAALILSIMIASLMRFNPTVLAAFCVAVCIGILLVFSIDLEALFALISRSGDAAEITTGTGRTAIWKTVIQLIGEKPLMGWGYASSVYILPQQSILIGYTVPHAHNAFLQIAFSTGMIGLSLFLLVFAIKIYFSFKMKDPMNMAFISFLLIDGMAEPIAFYGPATTTTLALAIVLSLRYRTGHEADYSPHQQRLSGLPESAQDPRDLKPG